MQTPVKRIFHAILMNYVISWSRSMAHADVFETQEAAIDPVSYTHFQAFDCDVQQSDTSSAQFSLNDPPICNISDGSVYHPPETRRAQVLQYIESIPVPVSICQVKLRISVGYCGGIGSAYNFMHASFEKHGAYIRTTKAACHQSSPDGTLQVSIPSYGNIQRVDLEMHLEGGLAEASFQPVGYSRPNSYFSGELFQPPSNDQSRITYLNFENSLTMGDFRNKKGCRDLSTQRKGVQKHSICHSQREQTGGSKSPYD